MLAELCVLYETRTIKAKKKPKSLISLYICVLQIYFNQSDLYFMTQTP